MAAARILSGSGRGHEGQKMKKFLVVTAVSFIVMGILTFIGLNFVTWLTKEIEAGNRPHHPPSQQLPNSPDRTMH
jgi:hypothetical protein